MLYTLHLLRNIKVHRVAMFVADELHKVYHAKNVGMSIIYLCTKFHMTSVITYQHQIRH